MLIEAVDPRGDKDGPVAVVFRVMLLHFLEDAEVDRKTELPRVQAQHKEGLQDVYYKVQYEMVRRHDWSIACYGPMGQGA